MTRRFVLAGIATICLVAPALTEEPPGTSSPFHVEAFMKHFDEHPGPASIQGIVWKTRPAERLFNLVDVNDRDELRATGATTCVALPVRWDGRIPASLALVIVDGQVETVDGRRVFAATAVKILEEAPKPAGGESK